MLSRIRSAEENNPIWIRNTFCADRLQAVLRIRIHQIHMFLGLPDPDPLVRGMEPDPDPPIIMQK